MENTTATKRTHTDTNTKATAKATAKQTPAYKEAKRECNRAWRNYRKARLACEESASLYGWNSEEYREACRVFDEAERKAEEADRKLAEVRIEAEAEATVAIVAEANPKAVAKDTDAFLELGEVDSETAWTGYLWDAVVAEMGEMDEETEMALASAIVDYYCDQMASLDDEDYEDYEEDEDC